MQNNEKIIIVTGGTGSLGRVVVNHLSEYNNYKLYLPVLSVRKFSAIFHNSNQKEKAETRKIYALECDAYDFTQVEKFVSDVATIENSKIDVLINLIGGIHPPCNIIDMPPDFFNKYFRLNFITAFNFTHSVLKYMSKNKDGNIIFVGAMAGLKAEKGRFAYSLGKSAIIHLMNTISKEMKDYNIRCNTIVPYIIDTEENRKWAQGDEYKKWIPPIDIANLISDLITGKKRIKESIIKLY